MFGCQSFRHSLCHLGWDAPAPPSLVHKVDLRFVQTFLISKFVWADWVISLYNNVEITPRLVFSKIVLWLFAFHQYVMFDLDLQSLFEERECRQHLEMRQQYHNLQGVLCHQRHESKATCSPQSLDLFGILNQVGGLDLVWLRSKGSRELSSPTIRSMGLSLPFDRRLI